MTFTEAAVEVLRLAGKPLHYKKITEIAIERNLLSHVGKTPEVTMSSRLATMVKKDRGDAPIVKVKPGVFGLRDFDPEVIKAAVTQSGHDYELPDEVEEAEEIVADVEDEGEADAETGVEAAGPGGEEVSAPHKLPGGDVFPEEDDDDEPILANLDEEEKRGRSKRRRRRRGGRREDGDEATPIVRVEPRAERPERTERNDRSRGRDRDRDRNRDRFERRPRIEIEERREPAIVQGDWNREPLEGQASGRDLADAIHAALESAGPRPLEFFRVAELLVRRGRLEGDPTALAPTVAAAIRSDTARSEQQRGRARFRESEGRVSLLDWALPREAVRCELEATRAADRQREHMRRAFVRTLGELPTASFVELVATWLNTEGIGALRAVRRPNGRPGEIHLAGVLRRAFNETGLAIVIVRDPEGLGRERVIELRGSLHHYANASQAWLITTGTFMSGAREEANVPGVAPCLLFDGIGLARAMEQAGVGMRRSSLPILTFDLDLLDRMRGGQRPVRERERDRDRDRDRDRGRDRDWDRDRRDREVARPVEADAEPRAEADDEPREQVADAENGERQGGRRRRRRRRGRDREQGPAVNGEATEPGTGPAEWTARDQNDEDNAEPLAEELDDDRDAPREVDENDLDERDAADLAELEDDDDDDLEAPRDELDEDDVDDDRNDEDDDDERDDLDVRDLDEDDDDGFDDELEVRSGVRDDDVSSDRVPAARVYDADVIETTGEPDEGTEHEVTSGETFAVSDPRARSGEHPISTEARSRRSRPPSRRPARSRPPLENPPDDEET